MSWSGESRPLWEGRWVCAPGERAGDRPPPQSVESEGEGEATPLQALRVSLCRLEKTLGLAHRGNKGTREGSASTCQVPGKAGALSIKPPPRRSDPGAGRQDQPPEEG